MGRRIDQSLTISSLETIYRHSYRRFFRLALAVTRDRDAAHDVVQEAFAKAIRGRFTFRGDAPPEAWVWRIVLNGARDAVRNELLLGDTENDEAIEPADMSWSELRAAVAALPERQRHVVFLRHYADLDYQGIAEVLEIERGTVAATLHAAHTTLRNQLREVPR